MRIADFFNNLAFTIAGRLQRPRAEYRRDGSLKGYVAFSVVLHVMLCVAVVIHLGNSGAFEGLAFNVALADDLSQPLNLPPGPDAAPEPAPEPVPAPPAVTESAPVPPPPAPVEETVLNAQPTAEQTSRETDKRPSINMRENLYADRVPSPADKAEVNDGPVTRGELTPEEKAGEVGRAEATPVEKEKVPPPVEKQQVAHEEIPEPQENSPEPEPATEYTEMRFVDSTDDEAPAEPVIEDAGEQASPPVSGAPASEEGSLTRPVNPARGLQALKSSFLNNRMALNKEKKRYDYTCTIWVNPNGQVDPNRIEITGDDPAMISVLRTILKFDSSLRFDPARNERGMPVAAPLSFDFWIDFARRDELGSREWIAGYKDPAEE